MDIVQIDKKYTSFVNTCIKVLLPRRMKMYGEKIDKFPYVTDINGEKRLIITDGFSISIIRVRDSAQSGTYFQHPTMKDLLICFEKEDNFSNGDLHKFNSIKNIAELMMNLTSPESLYKAHPKINGLPSKDDFNIPVLISKHNNNSNFGPICGVYDCESDHIAYDDLFDFVVSLGYLKIIHRLDGPFAIKSEIKSNGLPNFQSKVAFYNPTNNDVYFGIMQMNLGRH